PGWRAIGTVLDAAVDAPPRVTVDGARWSGDPGWQSF
ncbi:MAG: thiamine-phosphate kinase, partial [Mycobacterium sp.]